MRSDYPKRPAYFAMKFCRMLTTTGAANVIGSEAALLLITIAITEDAKRYAGAVTFWNEQLMPICGFKSKGRLVRARTKAVEAGWLHYEKGGNHICGRYWVKVPSEYAQLPDGNSDGVFIAELNDTPNADALPVQNRTANGRQADNTPNADALPVQNRTANGPRNGRQTDRETDGKRSPFIPSPKPNPKPSSSSCAEGDDDDGVLEVLSDWTREREAEVASAMQAAGAAKWSTAIADYKRRGVSTKDTLDDIWVATNHCNPSTGQRVLDGGAIVFRAETGFWPRENVPTADQLREIIANAERRSRDPQPTPADAQQRKLRPMKIIKAAKAMKRHLSDLEIAGIESAMDAGATLKAALDALPAAADHREAIPTPATDEARPRRSVRETGEPREIADGPKDRAQRDRPAAGDVGHGPGAASATGEARPRRSVRETGEPREIADGPKDRAQRDRPAADDVGHGPGAASATGEARPPLLKFPTTTADRFTTDKPLGVGGPAAVR